MNEKGYLVWLCSRSERSYRKRSLRTSQYIFELNSGGVTAVEPLLYSCWIYSPFLALQTTHSFMSFTLLFFFFLCILQEGSVDFPSKFHAKWFSVVIEILTSNFRWHKYWLQRELQPLRSKMYMVLFFPWLDSLQAKYCGSHLGGG